MATKSQNSVGLIFDVDGVIADTESVNAAASIRVFEELFGLRGVSRPDFEQGLGRGAEAYMQAAANVHGSTLTDTELGQATAARQDRFLSMLAENPLPPFPGVTELITAAGRTPDVHVAIATSSAREKATAVLRAAGVAFEQLPFVSGDQVQHKKPAPDVFAAAVRLLGIQPGRCVVIEDAPDGVAAAHAAGCRCIAVTNSTTPARLADADLVVDSLASVDLTHVRGLVEAGRTEW